MPLQNLLGNEPQKEILINSIHAGRVHHSYIFSGISGIGKRLFALEFAKLLNCDSREIPAHNRNSCQCTSCVKIEKNIHPDVRILTFAGEKTIRIDHIRTDIDDKIYLKPFESTYKIFIIDNAERMNINAQNAFLKTLEEPPNFSIIILITSSINFIIKTIKSRCQIINFFPISTELISQELRKTSILTNDDDITVASKIARGSLGRALSLDTEYLRFRAELLQQLMTIGYKNPSGIFELYKFMNLETANKDIEQQKGLLDLISLWIRDLLMLKISYRADDIVNSDMYNELYSYSTKQSIDRLLTKAQHLETVWYDLLRLHANTKLAFHDLFLKLSV